MKHTKRKKQLHKEKYQVVLGFLTSFILLCFASGVLFAKYYAGSSNKGVATASSLYFCSNVLRTIDTSTDDNTDNTTDASNYPIIYNTPAWDTTGACTLDVQIRNYQNQLLYNDRNLDITYNITFRLVGAPDGGTYKVSYGTVDGQTIDAMGYTFENVTLAGGTATTDTYKIYVKRPDSAADKNNYRSVGIQVTATPVSPSYVTNSACLGGILYVSTVSPEYKLEHSFAKVSSIGAFSGFPCTITYTPDEDNAAHEVKIIWSSELEIDQYNKYYLQAKGESDSYGTIDDKNDEDYGKKYIILTMEPYSSISITFYRGTDFNLDDKKDITLTDYVTSLNGYVELVDLTKETNSSEGSEGIDE